MYLYRRATDNEKCSPLSLMKEMQIRTIMGYHLTPIKTTSKRSPTANVEEDVEKWKPSTLLVGMYIGAAGFERCMDLSVWKTKNENTMRPSKSTFEYWSEEHSHQLEKFCVL